MYLSQYPQLEYIEAKEEKKDTTEPNQETTKIIGAKGLLEIIP